MVGGVFGVFVQFLKLVSAHGFFRITKFDGMLAGGSGIAQEQWLVVSDQLPVTSRTLPDSYY